MHFFKVDFEKAYDLVSWKCFIYMLIRLGFYLKWRKWIAACLQSATISILVNGRPTKEFALTRGLRQGDPLAPLLFNIVGEGLTGMMREGLHKNLYRSYLVGKQKEPTNILQYADDTLFVGELATKATSQVEQQLQDMTKHAEMLQGLQS